MSDRYLDDNFALELGRDPTTDTYLEPGAGQMTRAGTVWPPQVSARVRTTVELGDQDPPAGTFGEVVSIDPQDPPRYVSIRWEGQKTGPADSSMVLKDDFDSGAVEVVELRRADKPTTSMVALMLPDAIAKQVEQQVRDRVGDEAQAWNQLHVTLCCSDFIVETVARVCREYGPISMKFTGIAQFESSDGVYPTVATVTGNGLAALRTDLVRALKDGGVPVRENYDFTPHCTLAYLSDQGLALSPPTAEWTAETVEVAIGDTREPDSTIEEVELPGEPRTADQNARPPGSRPLARREKVDGHASISAATHETIGDPRIISQRALQCPECGAPLRQKTETCPSCGVMLADWPEVDCFVCGGKTLAGGSTCQKCGEWLARVKQQSPDLTDEQALQVLHRLYRSAARPAGTRVLIGLGITADWWSDMSFKEQTDYKRDHPRTKRVPDQRSRTKAPGFDDKAPAKPKKAPKDAPAKPKRAPKLDDADRAHLKTTRVTPNEPVKLPSGRTFTLRQEKPGGPFVNEIVEPGEAPEQAPTAPTPTEPPAATTPPEPEPALETAPQEPPAGPTEPPGGWVEPAPEPLTEAPPTPRATGGLVGQAHQIADGLERNLSEALGDVQKLAESMERETREAVNAGVDALKRTGAEVRRLAGLPGEALQRAAGSLASRFRNTAKGLWSLLGEAVAPAITKLKRTVDATADWLDRVAYGMEAKVDTALFGAPRAPAPTPRLDRDTKPSNVPAGPGFLARVTEGVAGLAEKAAKLPAQTRRLFDDPGYRAEVGKAAGQAIRRKGRAAVGMLAQELREYRAAGAAIAKMSSGQELSADEKKVIGRAVRSLAVTVAGSIAIGGLGHLTAQALATHWAAEATAKAVGRAALFASRHAQDQIDAFLTKMVELIAGSADQFGQADDEALTKLLGDMPEGEMSGTAVLARLGIVAQFGGGDDEEGDDADFEVGDEVKLKETMLGLRQDDVGEVVGVQGYMIGVAFKDHPQAVLYLDKDLLEKVPGKEEEEGGADQEGGEAAGGVPTPVVARLLAGLGIVGYEDERRWERNSDGEREHRRVMKEKLDRPLKPSEDVHHIDEDKSNNAPSNLEVVDHAEHTREHKTKPESEKKAALGSGEAQCRGCGHRDYAKHFGIDEDAPAGQLTIKCPQCGGVDIDRSHERRDQGRYDYSNLDVVCRCGHRLGEHADVSPRPCFADEMGDGCACERFQRDRRALLLASLGITAQEWWDSKSYEEQKRYIKKYPATTKKLTKKPQEPGKERQFTPAEPEHGAPPGVDPEVGMLLVEQFGQPNPESSEQVRALAEKWRLPTGEGADWPLVSGDAASPEELTYLQGVAESYVPAFEAVADFLSEVSGGGEVIGRIKSADSIFEKLKRREKERGRAFAPEELTDHAGTRLTHGNLAESQAALQSVISKMPEVDPKGTDDGLIEVEDLSDRARPGGYRSIHLLVRINGKVVEAQLRTTRQTWFADWAHNKVYKAPDRVKDDADVKRYAEGISDYLYRLDKGETDGAEMPPCPQILTVLRHCYPAGQLR